MSAVLVIGRGKVGTTLARALRKVSIDTHHLPSRPLGPIPASAIRLAIVAVADGAIAESADRLCERLPSGTPLVHCAGALGPKALKRPREAGYPVGAMHPLVSFADSEQPPTLAGTTFVIDGDPRAKHEASAIAQALGAHPVIAEIHGPAYHGAAALCANGAAALAYGATRILEALGLEAAPTQRALGALLISVGENVAAIGVPRALTGPVVRGDASTVAGHRRALEALSPSLRASYDATARVVLECAEAAGTDDEMREEVAAALRGDPRT